MKKAIKAVSLFLACAVMTACEQKPAEPQCGNDIIYMQEKPTLKTIAATTAAEETTEETTTTAAIYVAEETFEAITTTTQAPEPAQTAAHTAEPSGEYLTRAEAMNTLDDLLRALKSKEPSRILQYMNILPYAYAAGELTAEDDAEEVMQQRIEEGSLYNIDWIADQDSYIDEFDDLELDALDDNTVEYLNEAFREYAVSNGHPDVTFDFTGSYGLFIPQSEFDALGDNDIMSSILSLYKNMPVTVFVWNGENWTVDVTVASLIADKALKAAFGELYE